MKQVVISALKNTGLQEEKCSVYFDQLNKNYSSKNRHYHNWNHIEAMVEMWRSHKLQLENPVEVLASILYHDAVYKVTRNDNELKSAELACAHLEHISEVKLKLIYNLIMSTAKHHATSEDEKWLIDFDLQILGSSWAIYTTYMNNIRKEYRVYPDFIYKPGRVKVLNHFLGKEFIFKTKDFRLKYETQARSNLTMELSSLI